VQVKLLRVTQEREFERVGGSATIRVDVRVIAATNRDLERAIAERSFREDLYYRLAAFPVLIPPLRERSDDIPALVQNFIERYAAKIGRPARRVSEETLARLRSATPSERTSLRAWSARVGRSKGSRAPLPCWACARAR
jgi:transcriptional regulator with GAF, ATPase, and Fis domain